MRLVLFIGLVAAAAWGSVVGMQQLLSVDDLAGCDKPVASGRECGTADIIVAISGGDTAARTAEAIRLYLDGWAPKLVFSGAALDQSGPSNAEAMRRQAVAAGVPNDNIIVEGSALDTAQNAQRTSQLVGAAERIIVVTSPYHQRRAGLEFEHFFGERVTIINHPAPHDGLWSQYWWTTLGGWSLALSEAVKTLFVIAVPR